MGGRGLMTKRWTQRIVLFILMIIECAAGFDLHAASSVEELPLDLSGRRADPFQKTGARAVVLIFVRSDCPISNRYAPEIQRLATRFSPSRVVFWLVFVDPRESAEVIRKHNEEYGLRLGVLRDPGHTLVKMTGAEITPEAAVFALGGSKRQVVYRGRIDNRYADFGKERPAATTHDLEQALEAVLSKRPVAHPTTRAVGCFISDLE